MSTRRIPRMIIVDDIDPRIQYNGPWFPDVGSQDSVRYSGPPFRSTMHGTRANASFEFSYNGSNIQVYGSNNIRNDSGVIDPIMECFIDGISTGISPPYNLTVNNWLFCDQAVPDGPHILTVNATVMKNQTFWFADIRYIPSASTPLDQEIILVDPTDPQLQYGEGWRISSGSPITNANGSILTFDFIGGAISWYGGDISSDPSPVTYSIDGQTPINFEFSLNHYVDSNQRYFETAQLPVGPHTLKVVYQGKNTTPLILDYLVVQNGTLPSITTPVLPHATSTTGKSVPSGGHYRPAVGGAIIGSVIAGLALIILGVFLLAKYEGGAAKKKVFSSTPRTSDFELPLLSKADKEAEALAASESQPGGDTPPAMVSMQSDDTKSSDVGAHKDSGIQMPPDTPAENVIMEVPPLYTVEDESLVSHEKDISNNLYILYT